MRSENGSFHAARSIVAMIVSLLVAGAFTLTPSAIAAPLFADGFEEGSLARWTYSSGLRVQSDEVLAGVFAARATNTGSPAYGYVKLTKAYAELHVRASFKVISRGSVVTLLRIRRADGAAVSQVLITAAGLLALRNDVKGTTRTSTVTVPNGEWHTLDLHVATGSPGVMEVHFDGQLALGGSETVGGLLRRVQVGDDARDRRSDMVFDEVAVDMAPIQTVDAPPTVPRDVRLTQDPGSDVRLTWTPSTDESGIASYDVYRDNVLAGSVAASSDIYVEQPPSDGTVYSYRVVAVSSSGQRSASSDPFLVAMPGFSRPSDAVIFTAGDIACASRTPTPTSCWQYATSDIFVGQSPDAVLTLGDNQYEKGTLEAFSKSFDTSWGRAKTAILPVIGNHEYNTAGAAGYFGYFGSAAGDPSQGYYGARIASWKILALNGNCGIVSCAVGSTQYAWLANELATDPAECTLVAIHQPAWSSRRATNTSVMPLVQLLYDAGVELLLSGHDHVYERFAPQSVSGQIDSSTGIRQIIVGTGGRSLYEVGTIHPNSVVHDNTTFGVLKLTLHDGGYEWSFVPAWGHGSFSDAGADVCH